MKDNENKLLGKKKVDSTLRRSKRLSCCGMKGASISNILDSSQILSSHRAFTITEIRKTKCKKIDK